MPVKLTTEQFIEKAISVHGSKYDYSLVEYKTAKEKVTIQCPTHGVFYMTPNNHTHKTNSQGCPRCVVKHLTTPEFIAKAKEVHGDRYSYEKTVYTSADSTVTIECPIHGEFSKIAYNHTSSKQGCPHCSKKNSIGNRPKLTTEEFVFRSKELHGDMYNYSDTFYTDSRSKVAISCPFHGEFLVTPNNHLRGRACPSCATSGFDKSKPAILYYLSINNGQAYKIGITNRTVELRFSVSELASIKKLFELSLTGVEAYSIEQSIIAKFKPYLYTGPPILESGNTELFSTNILEGYLSLLADDKLTTLQTYLKELI